eukprot:scaffold43696_cov48-Attheya_sp.AAC.9
MALPRGRKKMNKDVSQSNNNEASVLGNKRREPVRAIATSNVKGTDGMASTRKKAPQDASAQVSHGTPFASEGTNESKRRRIANPTHQPHNTTPNSVTAVTELSDQHGSFENMYKKASVSSDLNPDTPDYVGYNQHGMEDAHFDANQENIERKEDQEAPSSHNEGHDDPDSDPLEDEEEPHWDDIAQHEPARTDVPIFLSARERRNAADTRFAQALDECNEALNRSIGELVRVAADVSNAQTEKLDDLERSLKQDFIYNEENRAIMQQRLEESATAAQGLFAQLMMRVSQPLLGSKSTKS